jgi:hypothetical protein
MFPEVIRAAMIPMGMIHRKRRKVVSRFRGRSG